MEKLRFDAAPESIYGLLDRILAVCPGCRGFAQIAPIGEFDAKRPPMFQPRRAVCVGCGFTREWRGKGLAIDGRADPVCDPYLGLTLWLQTPCAGHTLWAYNQRHLDLLESYVRAELRQTPANSTRMIPDALPEWMIVAKHRDEVLKSIDKLGKRL